MMLIALYKETSGQRIDRASAAIARACDARPQAKRSRT
jgi:hypothetical protein